MSRAFLINTALVVGLAVIVSLSWVGVPTTASWSRFLGSVLFYTGIEVALWFITQPLAQYRRELVWIKTKRRLPPE